MSKQFKVKHYRSRIYNPIRGKIIKAALALSAAALLFTVGWFAYEPLMERINDANKEIIKQNPVSVPQKEERPEEPPVDFIDKKTLAVTVPIEKLSSAEEYYSFLSALDGDVTAVVIDMKTAEGVVTYNSNQTSVKEYNTVSQSPIDIKARINTARSLGLDVVARIYAFQDSTAPYNAYDMAIRYQSEEGVLWLDDSVDNGGKPWLNPYSDTAQKYLLDIVCDAVDFGVDAVLLDGVRFPRAESIEYAYFGVAAETVTRADVLKQFVQRIYSATVTSETDLLIAYDGLAAISESEEVYGGSPATFAGDGLSPVIDLKAFVGERVSDEIDYDEMPEDVAELCASVYDALGYATDGKVMPTVVCAGLEKAQLQSLMSVFSEKGAGGYVLIYDEAFFNGTPQQPENPEGTEGDPGGEAGGPQQGGDPQQAAPETSSAPESSSEPEVSGPGEPEYSEPDEPADGPAGSSGGSSDSPVGDDGKITIGGD